MKKLFFLKPLPLIFFAAMCANADVVSSGKWSENSTWSEASAPITSSSNPYTDLSFASSGITLEVDSNQYADRIQLGSAADTTIAIDSGASLTLFGYDAKENSNGGPYYYISASDPLSKLTITGDGELVLSRTNETRFQMGQIVWDVNVTCTTGSFYLLGNTQGGLSSLTINKTANFANKQANYGNWKVILNSGANVTSGFLICGGSMEMAAGATYNIAGGANLSNATLNGTMVISSFRNYQTERMAAKISGTTVFGETASFTTTSTDSRARVLFNGNVTSNAAKNAINIAGTAFLNNYVVMNLNSSNAIKTGSASGQGDSTFYIVDYSTPKVGESYVDTFAASTATINLGANNDFGSLVFYDGSVLNLSTNGYNSTIGKIELYSGSGAYTINISNLTDFTLKINSLENINLEDDGAGNMLATDIFIFDEDDFKSNAYLIADTTNGGWWINATSEIPEPAEIAAIFGALALGLACCRKRK
ncbi:hypothetical protein [Frisingicoccus sp.]|uniref:hypothetical protein n=1 Tax=Frisingicoccus sp. TaxID=1918627 RepID=UPI003AB3B7BB